jgi:hypothetical protein
MPEEIKKQENIKDEDIKGLLKKNLELTEEIYKMTKGVKRFVTMQRIFTVLKLLIIVVPIVLGIIYLPPLIENLVKQYQDLLGITKNPFESLLKSGVDESDLNCIDRSKIPPELQKYLK